MVEAELDAEWRAQAVTLATACDIAFYDAAYHAVALVRRGVFVTADERYAARASQAGSISTLRRWRAP